MASSYSTRKRLNKQGTGDGTSTWGATLNTGVFDVVDFAMDGWTTLAVSADHTLSTADGSTSSNEAGARCLKLTTASATWTQTLPAREGWYFVWNATTAAQTIACAGGGTSVSVGVGEVVFVICDATNVKRLTLTTLTTALDAGANKITGSYTPSTANDLTNKSYVDAAITAAGFSMGTFGVPITGSDSGKLLTNNGSTPSWTSTLDSFTLTGATLTSPTITAPTITGGVTFSGSTKQNVQAVAALDLDLSASDFFTKSISTNSTFTFSNPTASKAQGFVVDLTISSAAVPTWPATVKWAFGSTPILGNGRHIVGFITDDGGTTYVGILGAQSVA